MSEWIDAHPALRTSTNLRHAQEIVTALGELDAEVPAEIAAEFATLEYLSGKPIHPDKLSDAIANHADALWAAAGERKDANTGPLTKAIQQAAVSDAQRDALRQAIAKGTDALVAAVRGNETAVIAAARVSYDAATAELVELAETIPDLITTPGDALRARFGAEWTRADDAVATQHIGERIKGALKQLGLRADGDTGDDFSWLRDGGPTMAATFAAIEDDTARRLALVRDGHVMWLSTSTEQSAQATGVAKAKRDERERPQREAEEAAQAQRERQGERDKAERIAAWQQAQR